MAVEFVCMHLHVADLGNRRIGILTSNAAADHGQVTTKRLGLNTDYLTVT